MKRILLLVPVVAAFWVFVSYAQTAPQLINYQGRLNDSTGMPINGAVDLTFRFYGAQTGDSLYLTVLQADVTVTDGIYNVLIGSGTVTPGTEPDLASVFQKHPEVWMGTAVGADPEMTPRQRITSAPYSLAVDLGYLARSRDFDGDGYISQIFGGNDCDDLDPSVYPGAPEIKGDGIDQSCDGYPFGPLDICSELQQCGIFEDAGQIEECQQNVSAWIGWGLPSVSVFADCLEGSTNCTQVENCLMTLFSDAQDNFCTELSDCGYMNMSKSECLNELSAHLDGEDAMILTANACISDGGTCSMEWLDRCMNSEGADFERSVQMPWGNEGFSIIIEATVLFSDTSESYTVRTPYGMIYELEPESGTWLLRKWEWYNSLDDLASAWPAGEYTILLGSTVKDVFTMPPYDAEDFPKRVIGIHPLSGSSVDDNPLTLHWQLTGPGSALARIKLHSHNWTRGGDEMHVELPPDALSGDVPIPTGTQPGDTLSVDVVAVSKEKISLTPPDRMFWQGFKYRNSPVYQWDGTPQ